MPMRCTLALLSAATLAAVAAPQALGAGDSSVAVVDLPVQAARTVAASTGAARFTLVGIHWKGPGRVSFRTRSREGRWSPWHQAAPEQEDRPDSGSPELLARAGWRLGNPWWVGPSDRVETRAAGRVTRVRAYLVWSPPIEIPLRMPSSTQRPAIVPRLSWGANEAIRRAPPRYASRLRFAVVHHTAGRNVYTRDEAPAIVRAIELYHVQGNGWNDIGYNFLVDRFGTIYEGRYGGIDRNVIGAHALGFNTGSVGVAVLGTYGNAAPTSAAQEAVESLLAWRLDLAHVDPLSMLTVESGGSERYRVGVPVQLRAVSGHRDTGLTECPGDALYARLGAIASAAAEIGGPKIFDPRVDRSKAGPVRFRARLSTALGWGVAVTDAEGTPVASGSGSGSAVDWTWDAAAPPATYRWTISAGSARPAAGSIKAGIGAPAAALAIDGLAATPATVSPNGDGQADVTVLTFALTAPAVVTVQVLDAAEAVVLTALDGQPLLAGSQSVTVDPSLLPDGSYSVVVRATGDDGTVVESIVPLVVSRLLANVSATPPVFSPNGDGRRDRLQIAYELTAPADVRVQIVHDGQWVATPLLTSLPAGTQHLEWDGSRNGGTLRDGSYEAVVEATDESGTASFALPFVSDTRAPLVRIVSVRPVRVFVSEPAVLKLSLDGVAVRRRIERPGFVRISGSRTLRRVRIVAWDEAGNASSPVIAQHRGKSKKRGQ